MVELSALWKNTADESQELDARLKVEEAQKDLESHITKAQQLLGQRERPGGLIAKYKVGSWFPWGSYPQLLMVLRWMRPSQNDVPSL